MKLDLESMKNEQADKQEHPHPVGPEILRGYKNIVASLLIFVARIHNPHPTKI